MVLPADQELSANGLLLEVALQAERLVPFGEHAGINRAVRFVAGQAAFAGGLVFKDEWTALRGVAFETSFVVVQDGSPSRKHRWAFVRLMTVAAGNLALENRVVRSETELGPLVEMALEAGLGRFAWIHDRVGRPARLLVNAPWSVAAFATNGNPIASLRLQTGMRRGVKFRHFLLMAFGAIVHADERGSGNLRRDHRRPLGAQAGGQEDRGNACQQDETPDGARRQRSG